MSTPTPHPRDPPLTGHASRTLPGEAVVVRGHHVVRGHVVADPRCRRGPGRAGAWSWPRGTRGDVTSCSTPEPMRGAMIRHAASGIQASWPRRRNHSAPAATATTTTAAPATCPQKCSMGRHAPRLALRGEELLRANPAGMVTAAPRPSVHAATRARASEFPHELTDPPGPQCRAEGNHPEEEVELAVPVVGDDEEWEESGAGMPPPAATRPGRLARLAARTG